jgi:hypothetical protein
MKEAMTDADRVAEFARTQLDLCANYHAQKENAAYVALALFAGVAGSILLNKDWPPNWGTNSKELAFLSLTLAWFAVLVYLRFQLHKRRWAALRVDGCERVLAMWATNQLTDPADLVPAHRESNAEIKWCIRVLDFFVWPLLAAVKAIAGPKEGDLPLYPRILVRMWEDQETKGTDALWHERLMQIVGWTLYIAVIARTV